MNFQKTIARAYDLIYAQKNYRKECQFVDKTIKKYSGQVSRTILDAGCGSGGHSLILAQKGYNVLGFDLSKSMIEIAKEKALLNNNVEFKIGDLRSFNFNKKFDVCLSMFAVLGYINKNNDILKTFFNIRKHLKIGGVLIFDVWNGLGVLSEPPENRERIFQNQELQVRRKAVPKLLAQDHICQVFYDFEILDKKTGKISRAKEKHSVRFYFPQEIKLMLEISGFQVLKVGQAFNIAKPADQKAWHMSVIAKAV